MHILYYITSHGYGHGIRSCSIINAIPNSEHITIRTMLPKAFFEEELLRPFDYNPGLFDCGCVQVDGVTVDITHTLKKYEAISDNNRTLLMDEVGWCKKNKVSCIVTDCTPFAIEVARYAGIPSVVITNFTWYDIYREYLAEGDEFSAYLEEIKNQYSSADLLLSLFPANPMEYMKKRIEVPVIGRVGRCIRDDIIDEYNLDFKKNIGLIYIGEYGMKQTQWSSIEHLKDWEFLSLYAIKENVSNFHLINKQRFKYQDLSASVDVVISKPGYGVVSECFVNGVPFLYLPRLNFAEYPVLVEAIEAWGGGYLIPEYDFYTLNWKPYLDRITSMSKPIKMESNGIAQCVSSILNITKLSLFG